MQQEQKLSGLIAVLFFFGADYKLGHMIKRHKQLVNTQC